MAKLSLLLVFIFSFSYLIGQTSQSTTGASFVSNSMRFNEAEILTTIETLNENNSFKELAEIINISKERWNQSEKVIASLSQLLKENHPIYKGKGYNEVLQFRAYLIYSFSFFPRHESIIKYIIYELNYSDYLNVKGASIYTARKYHDKILSTLIENYTTDSYNVKVNFTAILSEISLISVIESLGMLVPGFL